ncbi:MAG: hypothetical protein JXA16_04450 [Bacteroidales bacterium]|nr:hypothetical protein [Bacteroidales bacterium]
MKTTLLILTILLLSFIDSFSQVESDSLDFKVFAETDSLSFYVYALTDLREEYERFTPSQLDIQISESVISNYIDSVSNLSDSLSEMTLFNPNDYYKQFVGYIDSTENKILLINLINQQWFIDLESRNSQKKSFIMLMCANPFWYRQILINLKDESCSDFTIYNKQ